MNRAIPEFVGLQAGTRMYRIFPVDSEGRFNEITDRLELIGRMYNNAHPDKVGELAVRIVEFISLSDYFFGETLNLLDAGLHDRRHRHFPDSLLEKRFQ
jgi:hypothetical protein